MPDVACHVVCAENRLTVHDERAANAGAYAHGKHAGVADACPIVRFAQTVGHDVVHDGHGRRLHLVQRVGKALAGPAGNEVGR